MNPEQIECYFDSYKEHRPNSENLRIVHEKLHRKSIKKKRNSNTFIKTRTFVCSNTKKYDICYLVYFGELMTEFVNFLLKRIQPVATQSLTLNDKN